MDKVESEPTLSVAWQYIHELAGRTMSERVVAIPDEDALVVATGFLAVDKTPRHDVAVGRVSFNALGDNVVIELYDPRRVLLNNVPSHKDGMPMQGHMSTRRGYEVNTSTTHIGVDGELYRQDNNSAYVCPEPIDRVSKLAIFAYFELRIKALDLS